jgi:hypothetical protein
MAYCLTVAGTASVFKNMQPFSIMAENIIADERLERIKNCINPFTIGLSCV